MLIVLICCQISLLNTFQLFSTSRIPSIVRYVAPDAHMELEASDEFRVRLAVVEALRGVLIEDSDVVTKGWVGGVSATRKEILVELDISGIGESEANEIAKSCDEAASATRDALVEEDILPQGCQVMIEAQVSKIQEVAKEIEDETRPISLRGVKRVVAVASCKGGVGKSTVSTHLAFALRELGLSVGICDIDVYGPSLPTLVGVVDDPTVRTAEEDPELLEPFEKAGVKLMSFGFLNPQAAAMMRGSRVSGVIDQLARRVAWRHLDILIVDTPPGTGDAQLTLCQALPIDAAIVVTTPSRLAFADVVKGIDLFDTVNVPVVAIVENMAAVAMPFELATQRAREWLENFISEQPTQDQIHSLATELARPFRIFGHGFKRQIRDMWGIETFIDLDLEPDIARRSDAGEILFLSNDDTLSESELRAKDTFLSLGNQLLRELDSASAQRPELHLDGADLILSHRDETLRFPPQDLRKKCRCAACIQDPPTNIPPTLVPIAVSRTGNYALSIVWSDGHQSLLPFKALIPAYAERAADRLISG